MREDWEYRRGDVYLADLNPVVGAEIGGIRPVLVLQNNIGNHFGPTLIAAPMTSNIEKKPDQPTHFLIRNAHGLKRPSMVILEQLRTLDKNRIIKYMGKIDRRILESPAFCKCLAVAQAMLESIYVYKTGYGQCRLEITFRFQEERDALETAYHELEGGASR